MNNTRSVFEKHSIILTSIEFVFTEKMILFACKMTPALFGTRTKIQAAVINACVFYKIREEYGSFAKLLMGLDRRKDVAGNWMQPFSPFPIRFQLT